MTISVTLSETRCHSNPHVSALDGQHFLQGQCFKHEPMFTAVTVQHIAHIERDQRCTGLIN